MDCVRSPLLHLLGVKVMLLLALGLPYPKVSWCFARSHSFGVGFCMCPSRHTVLCVGHGKPDGVFAVVAAGIPQGL